MTDRLCVGTRKGLFTFVRDRSGWSMQGPAFLGAQIPILLPNPRDGRLHVAVEHGHFGAKFHRSEDGGASFQELAPPAYPEKPADAPEIMDVFRQVPVPWSLEKIWSLEAGGPDQPGRLWCGTIPGGLFRSDDNGDSWQLVRSLWDRPERARWAGGGYDFPGIHSICVDPRSSQTLVVAISCGGVWRSEDDGATWEQGAHGMAYDFLPADQGGANPDGQDPHRMVQCRANPDRFWVQHHCGLYYSNNAARSWTEVTGVQPTPRHAAGLDRRLSN